MSCNSPFLQQKYDFYGKPITGVFDRIPCHWCFGCRLDRVNMWLDRINYARVGHPTAFVTFTYDDNFLIFNNDGIPSLCRDDFSKFIDKLQDRVKRSKNPLIETNFKFFAVGEYGHQFRRPHYHILFIGIDFFAARRLFYDTWQYGIIDSLPILDGGIRYVLKYMDEQINGELAKMMYDASGIERPFTSMSRSLGADLYYSQYDFCQRTGTYKNLAGKIRPLPQYYKNLFLAPKNVDTFERKLADYDRRFNDPSYRYFDEYDAQLAYARERTFGDLALQKGDAVLRVGRNTRLFGNASVRQYLYEQTLLAREREMEAFDKLVLKKFRKFQNIA